MRRGLAVVLVVHQDREAREQIVEGLEAQGYQVLGCPGPGPPDYTCVGGRGLRCPLAALADAVVLDLFLAGDVMVEGTTARELLSYYRGLGKPVVALTGGTDATLHWGDELVVSLRWQSPLDGLAEALRGLLGSPTGARPEGGR